MLALVCHLLSLAALFLLLRAEFVAAAQVVVYAGAVMVLYVFVVSYVGGQAASRCAPRRAPGACGVALSLFAGAAVVELCIAMLGSGLQAIDADGAAVRAPASARPGQIGELLLTKFLLPVRGRVVPAARSPPSARSCSRAGAAAWTTDDRARVAAPMDSCVRDEQSARWPRASALAPTRRSARAEPAATREPSEAALVSIAWYLAVSAR